MTTAARPARTRSSVAVRLAGVDVPTSPQPGSETGTPYTLAAATYTVAADGVPGYTFAT